MRFKRTILVAVSLLYWAIQTAGDWVRRRLNRPVRDRCIVLYYHGVRDAQRARFHTQMVRLASWTPVMPLTRLARPGRVGWNVCVTFDDGFDNVRRNALPSLTQLGLAASVFVVTGNLGLPPRWLISPRDPDAHEPVMTAEQVVALARAGVEIGSHTVHHANLTTLPSDELSAELRASKRSLEALLGLPVCALSLPFGAYDRATLRAARDAGYTLTLTVEPERANPAAHAGLCGRCKVDPDDWRIEFWLKARGAYAWHARLRTLRRAWAALHVRAAGSATARRAGSRRSEAGAVLPTTFAAQD